MNPTLPILADGSSLLMAGILAGGVMLCAGLALGYWLGMRRAKVDSELPRAEMQRLIDRMSKLAQGVMQDMTEYREVMDLAQKRVHDLQAGPGVEESSLPLLAQMTQANELLQLRILGAEQMLKEQSEQIVAHMNEARTDALTGLPNRRAFDDEFQRRIAQWRRHKSRFLLILVDIDRFKQVNDTLGHPAGDSILTQAARSLRETIRDTDFIARYGGEEFALLLSADAAAPVLESVERIRCEIAEEDLSWDGRPVRITVSCGAAEPLAGEEAKSLLRRADSALYAAKQAGRDRSFFHDGEKCIPLGDAVAPVPAPIESPADSEAQFRQVCADLRRRLEEVTGKELNSP